MIFQIHLSLGGIIDCLLLQLDVLIAGQSDLFILILDGLYVQTLTLRFHSLTIALIWWHLTFFRMHPVYAPPHPSGYGEHVMQFAHPDFDTMIALLHDSTNAVGSYILPHAPGMSCLTSLWLLFTCNLVLKCYAPSKNQAIHCMISYETLHQILTSAWAWCKTSDSVFRPSADHSQQCFIPIGSISFRIVIPHHNHSQFALHSE